MRDHQAEAGGRKSVYARSGMVATSQPQAAQAGLFMLREGGNAVDAALAAAIALTVVEPTSNGLGSDAFAIVSDGRELFGLNGSGRLPGAYEPDRKVEMPESGWLPVMTPGAPRAWHDLHTRFGQLPFARLFEPAIAYAREGFPLSPVVAHFWRRGAERFQGSDFRAWQKMFMPEGFEPLPGAVWKSSDLADTLERIAASAARDFYEGTLARKMDRAARSGGGWLREEDLAGHRSDWVTPWSIAYHDHEVFELPPNSQGVVALEALGILGGSHPFATPPAAHLHDSIEAIKLAFEDALDRVGDCAESGSARELLESRHLAKRRGQLGPNPYRFTPPRPFLGGTVYLASADQSGLMVSFIQSNYMGFGSGVVIPGTGIALSNRALCFSFQDQHPNRIGPLRRSYHTLMPGFLMSGGRPLGPFGVMGGFMQPQGHLQIVQALVDQGLDPQGAIDRSRWRWDGGLRIALEPDFPKADARALEALGHEVVWADSGFGFGRAQVVLREHGGGFVAGSDSRADGMAVGC